MGIGPRVRRLFGRHERWISEVYRGVFVDLDAFVRAIAQQVDSPRRVLEIGCGEGLVTERLAGQYPHASLTGIDICGQPGRLFRGDAQRVRFLRAPVAQLCETEPLSYQLVVIADVLHHVPEQEREVLLSRAAELIAPGGVLVFKEWIREPTPIHLMAYCADRFITGDRVHFMRETELRATVNRIFGPGSIHTEFRVRPGTATSLSS